MKAVAETIAALGAPVSMSVVGDELAPNAVIARWRHTGGEMDIGASDVVMVGISLHSGQYVRQQTSHATSHAKIQVGSVSAMPAHQAIQTSGPSGNRRG